MLVFVWFLLFYTVYIKVSTIYTRSITALWSLVQYAYLACLLIRFILNGLGWRNRFEYSRAGRPSPGPAAPSGQRSGDGSREYCKSDYPYWQVYTHWSYTRSFIMYSPILICIFIHPYSWIFIFIIWCCIPMEWYCIAECIV